MDSTEVSYFMIMRLGVATEKDVVLLKARKRAGKD